MISTHGSALTGFSQRRNTRKGNAKDYGVVKTKAQDRLAANTRARLLFRAGNREIALRRRGHRTNVATLRIAEARSRPTDIHSGIRPESMAGEAAM